MATQTAATPTKITTRTVRFSYAHVFQPQAIEEGQDPKYSCVLLIPKKDTATMKAIQEAIKVAKEEGIPMWGGKLPVNLKLPLRDGDIERPDDEAYQGMWFLSANSPKKPGVVDADLKPILEDEKARRAGGDLVSPEDFYSGCWGRASIKIFPFNKGGSKGVGVALNNVQKLRDGERLGGGSTPEEDFGDDYQDDDYDPLA